MKKHDQVWVSEFEGHTIKIINEGKAKLLIDGVEAAKEKGLIHLSYEMSAPIPDTDYIVMAKIDGTKDSVISCEVFVAKEANTVFGKEDENGTFTAYSQEEIAQMKEDAQAAIDTAAFTTLFLN